MSNLRFTNDELLAAWQATRSAALAAIVVGCSKPTLYARLRRLGVRFSRRGKKQGSKGERKRGSAKKKRAAVTEIEFEHVAPYLCGGCNHELNVRPCPACISSGRCAACRQCAGGDAKEREI